MEKYIVTSYEHPDLDGISSMYAYSEYLNKTGKESRYYVRENIKTEPHIVCDMFGIELDSVDEIEEDAKNIGGITIFGSEFGNYNQDINVKVHYTPNV